MRGIHHLELYNFKSYRGKHTIGPFKHFSAVVGPNGSGKSNVMDAITFVLGVAAGKIRAEQVKELINVYGPDDDTPNTTAYVEMVFEAADGSKSAFRRSIKLVTRPSVPSADSNNDNAATTTTTGETTYSVDGVTVPKKTYEQRLCALGIVVRSSLGGGQSFPNFLVPQNEVALVAQKTPQQLAQFLEVVSGSADRARDYDDAEARVRAAEDAFVHVFRQRQSMNKEHRQVKELVTEERLFRAKLDEHAQLKHEFYLVQLFYVDRAQARAREELAALRARQSTAERTAAEATVALEGRQRALAEARRALGKLERRRNEHRHAIAAAQPDAARQGEQARFLQRTVRECEAKLAALAQHRGEREAALKTLRDELAALRGAQERFEREAEAEAARGGGVSAATLAEYHAIKTRVEEETATLREALGAMRRQLAAAGDKAAAADALVAVVERNLGSVRDGRDGARARKAAAERTAEETRAALREAETELAALVEAGSAGALRKEQLLKLIQVRSRQLVLLSFEEIFAN